MENNNKRIAYPVEVTEQLAAHSVFRAYLFAQTQRRVDAPGTALNYPNNSGKTRKDA